MFQSRAAGLFGSGAGDLDDGDAVVLLVVGDETDEFVAVRDRAPEKGGVEVDHRLEVRRAQDYVG